jgi:Na+/H+ antiporter NhaD/arsenite permease-like protein
LVKNNMIFIASAILVLTYIGISFTQLPHINIDRPAAALTGALLMVLAGVLTFNQAVESIDFHTIALLLGMMLLMSALQQADFFNVMAARSISLATKPWQLLLAVILVTAVGSAFMVNDVVVLLFTPVVIAACRLLDRNPVPYLIAEAMASNIGSVATEIGNPQNMLIGVTSGIPFTRFLLLLLPVALVSIIVLFITVFIFYRKHMRVDFQVDRLQHQTLSVMSGQPTPAARKKLLLFTLPVFGLTVVCLFLSSFIGVAVSIIAMAGGVAAILFSGIRPSKLIKTIDWSLLLFFCGLFIVIGGAQKAGVLDIFLNTLSVQSDIAGIVSVNVFSALVSQVVSNVPLVMLVIPVIQNIPGDVLWISLAAGSTLGGNATIIGAVANIIVVEQAYSQGVKLGWWEFSKVGIIVTVLTIAASIGILSLEFSLGLLR